MGFAATPINATEDIIVATRERIVSITGDDVTNVDLGYRLRRSAWGKGYATEGSRALIAMGFTELGVNRVFGHTMTVNTASRGVMEKCGMTLVHTIPYRGDDVIEGAEHGEVEYALTRTKWESGARKPGA